MLNGENVFLRAVEESDLPQLMAWRNLPQLRKYFREYREINLPMQKRWFESIAANDKNTLMFSICHRETGELLGCCGLCSIHWVHRHAEISLYIGHREAYIDTDGYALDCSRVLLDYAFRQLNLHKIWAEIYAFDHPKKGLLHTLGFRQEGILRDHCFYDGKWWDSLLFSLLQEEFDKKEGDTA